MSRPIAFARHLGLVARKLRVNSGPLVSKTDQTAQTDRRIENEGRFMPSPGRKLTSPHSELTSGPDQGGQTRASVP